MSSSEDLLTLLQRTTRLLNNVELDYETMKRHISEVDETLVALCERLSAPQVQTDLLWSFSESSHATENETKFGDTLSELDIELLQQDSGPLVEVWRNAVLDLYLGIHALKNTLHDQILVHDDPERQSLLVKVNLLERGYNRFIETIQPIYDNYGVYQNQPPYTFPSFSDTPNTVPVLNQEEIKKLIARLRWHHLTPSVTGGGVSSMAGAVVARSMLGLGALGATGLGAAAGVFGFYSMQRYPAWRPSLPMLGSRRRPQRPTRQPDPGDIDVID